MSTIVPPPWTLKGRGFILVYRLERQWLLEHGFIPESRLSSFVGGLSAVMLVDYRESNCGPYFELLFVPGRFREASGVAYYAITKIFVSTQISVDSGIANWAIPKERADFSWNSGSRTDEIRVSRDEHVFFEAKFSSGAVGSPFNAGWIPAPLRTLAQPELEPTTLRPRDQSRTLLTAPNASGGVRLARLLETRADSAHFPDLAAFKPLVVIKADPFKMTFPVPTVL
jgi:hypothetical protein